MQKLQAETPFANTALNDEVAKTAQERLAHAMGSLTLAAAELDMAEDLAAMFRQDPLKAEVAFRDRFHELACSVLRDTFELIDDHGVSLEAEGEIYRKVEASTGHAMTLFGPVAFDRSRYRPSSGGGEALFPTESVLGLTECGLTPAAAGLSLYFMSNLTARESAEAWERLCGKGPSASTLVQISTEAGRRFEGFSGDLMVELRADEELHEDAVALLVSLDGVMVRMNAETVDGHVVEPGWREASSGIVAMLDAEGNTVQARYFGRLPEQGKTSLKARASQEVFHWLRRKEDLKVVAIADAARDNWSFLDTLCPDVMLVDFWHSTQHLKVAADCRLRSGQRGRHGLVREMAPHPSSRSQGGRQGDRRTPLSETEGKGQRRHCPGTRFLSQQPKTHGLQRNRRCGLSDRFGRRGKRESHARGPEAEEVRPALGT